MKTYQSSNLRRFTHPRTLNHNRRKRLQKRRRFLRYEMLEPRLQLSGVPYDPFIDQLDNSDDGRVTPLDVLNVISYLNSHTDTTAPIGQHIAPVPPNTAPVAFDITVSVTSGSALSIAPGYSDTDGDAVSLSLDPAAQPTFGSVIDWGGGVFIYTPTPTDVDRTDSFGFRATDEHGATDLATVTVNVSGVHPNHPPVAADRFLTVQSGDTVVVTPNVTDSDGDAVTLTLLPIGPTFGTAVNNGNGSFTYASQQVEHTTNDSFAYRATDVHGATDDGIVQINLVGRNHPPQVFDFPLTVPAGGSVGANITGTDPDIGDTVTISLNPAAPPSFGTVVDQGGGHLVYTAFASSVDLTDYFGYVGTDNHGATDTANITVLITGAGLNDAPVDGNPDQQFNAVTVGTVVTIPLGVTDPNGDTLSYTVVFPVVAPNITVNSLGTVTFTSQSIGTQAFVVRVDDGHGGTVDARRFVNTYQQVAGEGEAADSVFGDKDLLADVLDPLPLGLL